MDKQENNSHQNNLDGQQGYQGTRGPQGREVLARVKLFIDVVLGLKQ